MPATFPIIEPIPHRLQYLNIVFFAVLVSTVAQGSTFETGAAPGIDHERAGAAAPAVGVRHDPAGPAEVLEYTVGPGEVIAGARVRDLGLPRDAAVSVIVRAERAIPPRGSTQLRVGDELHLLIGEESAHLVRDLLSRGRTRPIAPPPRPPRPVTGRRPIFSIWSWNQDTDGDASHPHTITGQPVIEQLRIRRDQPGGLWVLTDGRYALTGPLAAVGSRGDLTDWAR